jgi:hypothetical protein
VNCLRVLARFGCWQSLQPLLSTMLQQEAVRVANKRAAAGVLTPLALGGALVQSRLSEQEAAAMRQLDADTAMKWEQASPWMAHCGAQVVEPGA